MVDPNLCKKSRYCSLCRFTGSTLVYIVEVFNIVGYWLDHGFEFFMLLLVIVLDKLAFFTLLLLRRVKGLSLIHI